MALKPGEAAVLLVIRNEKEPDKYFVSLRRSDQSSFDRLSDFIVGSFQVPVSEFKDTTDLAQALNLAIARLKEI
jgi:hypothetical protein